MKDHAKVMVAGGGIGGLTAAISRRRAGFEVAVFERAAKLGEVGAGLLLTANAQKALGKLGLAEAEARLGTPASPKPTSVIRWPTLEASSRARVDDSRHVLQPYCNRASTH